jgi:hypothetical protein
MNDLKERLDAASRLVSSEPDGYERLAARRERAHRRQRVSAAVVALVLTVAVFAALTVALPRDEPGQPGSFGADEGAFAPADLALGPGEYFYQRIGVIPPEGQIEQETWWAVDGSGRRRVTGSAPNWTSARRARSGQAGSESRAT